MMAYEYLAKCKAGLTLCGRDGCGQLEWIGTRAQWNDVEKYEMSLIWK